MNSVAEKTRMDNYLLGGLSDDEMECLEEQIFVDENAFLELQSPLLPEYRRFAHTGENGFGDPSEAISAGRITIDYPTRQTTVSLPRPLITRLQSAYDFWCAAIRRSCPTIRPAVSADQRGSSRNS